MPDREGAPRLRWGHYVCVCVLLACACGIPCHRKRGCRVTPSGALVTGYTGRTCRRDLFPPGPLPGKRGGECARRELCVVESRLSSSPVWQMLLALFALFAAPAAPARPPSAVPSSAVVYPTHVLPGTARWTSVSNGTAACSLLAPQLCAEPRRLRQLPVCLCLASFLASMAWATCSQWCT